MPDQAVGAIHRSLGYFKGNVDALSRRGSHVSKEKIFIPNNSCVARVLLVELLDGRQEYRQQSEEPEESVDQVQVSNDTKPK